MKLLITFGCSWTYGVGVGYTTDMSRLEYKSIAWDQELANRNSFRGILSKKLNMHNLNFSKGGCSNQEQFRLAENFFSSIKFDKCKETYDSIVVLWGITSVLRNEVYFANKGIRESFFYSDDSLLSKIMIAEHYSQFDEIDLLSKKIRFWDKFFDLHGIKNIWFDTFNHHDYHGSISEKVRASYETHAGDEWPPWDQFRQADFTGVKQKIVDEILDTDRLMFYNDYYDPTNRMVSNKRGPRDLMSQLAIKNGMDIIDDSYHESSWKADGARVSFLTSMGLLNRYSYHPTAIGHQQIAAFLVPYF